MRRAIGVWAMIAGSVAAVGQAPAKDDPAKFDGTWDTVLSCGNVGGALGYVFRFDSVVKLGQLHADKGTKGQPGWLTIDGKIGMDGVSHLLADGLVGAADAAVGHRPAGTSYSYHVDATFAGEDGTGKRVEGRPCDVTFHRTKRAHAAD